MQPPFRLIPLGLETRHLQNRKTGLPGRQSVTLWIMQETGKR